MSYDLEAVLRDMVQRQASNAHIKVRTPVYFRVLDQLERTEHPVPGVADLEGFADQLLQPEEMERRLDTIVGVGESGLFCGLVHRLGIGRPDGPEVRDRP